jgi:hypothetical protein
MIEKNKKNHKKSNFCIEEFNPNHNYYYYLFIFASALVLKTHFKRWQWE